MVLFAVTDMKSLNPPVSQVLKTVVLACDIVALFYVVTNILEEHATSKMLITSYQTTRCHKPQVHKASLQDQETL